MIYLICFAVSIFFCSIANKNFNNKKSFYFLSCFAILPVVLIATYRGLDVGTDVKIYLYPVFEQAQNFSEFMPFYNKIFYIVNDILFDALIFCITKIFNDFNAVNFLIHLIICSLMYFGAYNFRQKANPAIIYMLFLFIFYNMSLNIIRQFLAMSIIFYSFKYVLKNKNIHFFIMVALAYLFHKSAIIGIIIFVLYKFSNSKHKYLLSSFTVVGVVTFLVFYNDILALFANIGLIPYKYVTRYYLQISEGNFNFFDTFILAYMFLVTLFKSKNLDSENKNFYVLMSILALILLQIGIFVPYGNRISWYFYMFAFVGFSTSLTNAKKDKLNLSIITLIMLLIYNIYIYIVCNNGNTYPYIFYNY